MKEPNIEGVTSYDDPESCAVAREGVATSPLLASIGGVYLKDNDVSPIDDEPRPLTADTIPSEVASHSIEPESARRLWALSERLLET